MLDPRSRADRKIWPPTGRCVSVGGRRRFGDACLAGRPAIRPPGQAFLAADAGGIVACQILLLPGFELGELAALTDVFECANRAGGRALFDWRLASLDGGPVRSAAGLAIGVNQGIQDASAGHLFLLAAYGSAPAAKPGLAALLRRRHAMGVRVAAIGSACGLLADSGLLAARPCAAPWSLAAALAERCHGLEVADRLYAMDDRIATCAGRDAIIDFTLRLIGDLAGEPLARMIADRLNHARPRDAAERQLSEHEFSGQRGSSAIAHTIAAMRRRLTDGEELHDVAAQSGVSRRQLQRLFRRHLGMTPTQYFLKARLQRARHLLQYSTLSVTEIAIATGFASISHFTRRFAELYGRTPTAERGRAPRRGREAAGPGEPNLPLARSAA